MPGTTAADPRFLLAFVSLAGSVFVGVADPARSQPPVTDLVARQTDRVTTISWRLGRASSKPLYNPRRDRFIVQSCYEGDELCWKHGIWNDHKVDPKPDGMGGFTVQQTTAELRAGTDVSRQLVVNLDGVQRKPLFVGTTQIGKAWFERTWEIAKILAPYLGAWIVGVVIAFLFLPWALVVGADHAAKLETVKVLGPLVPH